jgi:ech hydrogenase subunit D
MTGQTEKNQIIETIGVGELLGYVQERKLEGWRLGVMIANLTDENVEIIYVFEKEEGLKNARILVPANAPAAPSITLLYGYAFVYENELHDLFGVKFEGLQLDFGGNYFVTGEKTPWNPLAPIEVPEVPEEVEQLSIDDEADDDADDTDDTEHLSIDDEADEDADDDDAEDGEEQVDDAEDGELVADAEDGEEQATEAQGDAPVEEENTEEGGEG